MQAISHYPKTIFGAFCHRGNILALFHIFLAFYNNFLLFLFAAVVVSVAMLEISHHLKLQ
jgi:hypothetical protein